MLDLRYLAAVLATVFVINVALRAVPFAILQPLRKSRFVEAMAIWMPVGILVILAASTFRSVSGDVRHAAFAAIAVALTAAAHLLGGRRTLLSVGVGTVAYVLFVNCL
ncbi:branched-chain amino acid transporter AzlD [Mycobacterium sp. CBMA293]|uniref:AzlD domain-containing protein n=1 Tax=unclassified Mycolicibacterium TaxID=2636767 RepID=UPI0012DC2C22|nr:MULTISPECIES: AzlD domain-containing protein [unclassified Mycolicibacterium]MUL45838.1 branched-chain amino acid transporter AzlD [Mycolicibacterium sp. CBMA 360]MUL60510.1 branched-chain amino acid transporter AzlD [Mycolicibacterium sp. CBMA 335]MUL72325.1 branched-chain amino acid transporter AzlD [Mycolicibacterium sp. CBMA 311]MUL95274.1 branched-chain amino acid transporter AzlD [Mycolicibacterium sp. CBMA 230]MUM06906.1 branched-chain amino acid transporter AzlD [Mycolicibacterium s